MNIKKRNTKKNFINKTIESSWLLALAVGQQQQQHDYHQKMSWITLIYLINASLQTAETVSCKLKVWNLQQNENMKLF